MSEENKTVELKDKELKQVSGGTSENVNGDDGSNTIDITIKDIYGGVKYFTLSPETTIYDIKVMWAAERSAWVYHAHFIYEAKELDDSRTLASYNFASGTIIHVVMK